MSPVAHPFDPDAVSVAVLSCPYVAGLDAGVLGEVATYLPGRRIRGVRGSPAGVEVHVVGVYGPSIQQIVDQVRAAVLPLVPDGGLTVHVADLADPVEFATRPAGSVRPPRRGPSRA